MQKTQFEQAYFITPHAVRQFKQRVANITAKEIIEVVQLALQNPGNPVDVEPRGLIYAAKYQGKPYYIPVIDGGRGGSRDWLTVPTILGEESVLHGKVCKMRRKEQ